MLTDPQRRNGQAGPPESFVKQVKDALEHLYDFPYLQRHPLAHGRESNPEHPRETAGQQVRRELMDAIEALNPGPSVPFRAPHARLYNLLHMHYVEGMTIRETAHELGISMRQTYRDLRHGEESVAAMLWPQRCASVLGESSEESGESMATRLSSVQAEVARLETRARSIDVRSLLHYAREAVERMASQRGVDLHLDVPSEPVVVSTDPVVARQVLISTLSQAVQQAQPGILGLRLVAPEDHYGDTKGGTKADTGGDDQASIVLSYAPDPSASGTFVVSPVVSQLTERLGWVVTQEDRSGSERSVALHMAIYGPTVLVIDDNEGLVELLGRYLTGQACRVMAAASGQAGLRLAQETVPDAIVLDVMMPGMDGWELLQRLRTHPQTANIPVLICSVFNDPDLAYSLGASLFLPKPVSRDDVLAALDRLGVV